MHVLSQVSRPYDVDSLVTPIGISHYWSFSGHMLDFKLEKLTYLEETHGPTMRIRVKNIEMEIPTSWSVMAVDKETYTVDSIPIPNCATFNHDILLFSPGDTKLVTCNISIVNFSEKKSCIHPMVPKGSAMIHPVGTQLFHGKPVFYGIVCGPFDLHRFIGDKTIGDILG